MTLMGFSLTCGILSALFLFLYSHELAVATQKTYRYYSWGSDDPAVILQKPVDFNSRDSEEHALVGSLYGFFVVELIVAMWSVAICLVNDQHQLHAEDEPVRILSVRKRGCLNTNYVG